MLRLNKYFLFIVILTVTSYSQETVEQRRNREHQAVIDYINRTYPNYPVNTNQSLGSDKSIGLNLFKPTVRENPEWKRYLMNGNNVAVEIWNYGGIGPGLPGDALSAT